MIPEMGVLPHRVRIRRFETAASYAARLETVNDLSPGSLRVIARSLVSSRTAGGSIAVRTLDYSLESLLETSAGLAEGHFRRQRDLAGQAPDLPRYLCPYCAHGWVVEQFPHSHDYCCLKHRIWTGPGTSPLKLRRPSVAPVSEQQAGPHLTTVSDDVLKAERWYRKLQTKGLASAALIAELAEMASRPGTSAAGLLTPENYPAVISIARLLNQHHFLQTLCAHPARSVQTVASAARDK